MEDRHRASGGAQDCFAKLRVRGNEDKIQTARKKGRKEGRKEGKEGREGSGSYQILKLETITRRNLYAKLELGKCKSFAI